MKHILLILGGNFNNGGTENYNLILLKILKKYYSNYFVDIALIESNSVPVINVTDLNANFIYFDFKKNDKKESLVHNLFRSWIELNNSRKWLNLISKNYDLIIDSSFTNPLTLKAKENYYLIQHFDLNFYYSPMIFSNFNFKKIFTIIYRFIFRRFNFLKKLDNFIVFTNIDAFLVSKINKNIKTYPIPLPSKITPIKISDLNLYNNKSRMIFLGRLASQKNIDKLIKINESLGLIDFYGKSFDKLGDRYQKDLITKKWYKGVITYNDQLIEVLHKYKFMILYSKYEGFSFSLVEALSQGVPIIVKNSYLSASYLCNEKTGLLLPKDTTEEEDIILIKKFISMSDEKYHEYQINCLKFYNENLNINIFSEKWMKIFDKYLERK